ncbi:zinc finger CCCH domain-containing protein 11A isoform X3 [Bufo gargarizans]|uniref:zinc finger CCCH domain-containing protein 11A isoform X3 n=1 Tax=Bufo gargarizans TaxID=30331 RepID=UPI001CF1DAF7|nr:zinc finger CCCH domain-containing protein 11A isoform X3 [Bufo gargarizans]
MSNQGDDCYFFFYSTCTKGDSCAFRHCEAALGNETVCSLWQEGRCFRQICKFRHMEIDKKRSEIACYWENQISGCQKANCAFHHTKGRFVDGAYFPPSKAVAKPEPSDPDVQTSVRLAAPAKLSGAPTPQIRGVKKMEATENVPSPTHPPVVINAADDDEDDDDQFSEEGEEIKSSAQHCLAPGNQQGTTVVSTRKSLTPRKDVDLNYGIKTLKEIKSEKQKNQGVANDPLASPEILVSSFNQIDSSISVLRTVKFTNKDSTTKLSLAQRLGKRKTFHENSSIGSASGGEVLPFVKKTLSERLGKKITPSTDSPECLPKKGSTEAKMDQSTAEPSLPTNKAAEEENQVSMTFGSPVKTSNKEPCKKDVDTKPKSGAVITDFQTSALADGSNAEVLKSTILTVQKKGKPKLNVELCVVKNPLPVKAAMKQKAQERTIVAEVKPMNSAVTCSEGKRAAEMLPVIDSSEEPSTDCIPQKRLKISSQASASLPCASVTVQPPLKSPRTSTASVGKTSMSAEDEFDELMWEISDDKLEAELELDSNKDEDALLLELSKMIDS